MNYCLVNTLITNITIEQSTLDKDLEKDKKYNDPKYEGEKDIIILQKLLELD